ncbi:MAG: hypothetical protein KAR20_14720, partial [Candidatus Heimdallarchaeota archaeon]|nr:hypothetical protein [Candidatus Heimdallarchaeota archaeon]
MKSDYKKIAACAIAVLLGLFLVFIAPGFMDSTMDKLILAKTKQGTVFASGPLTRLYIGAIYSGIEMLVGMGLVVISVALYKGRKFAWPVALVLVATPAVCNFYIGLGWLENLKEFPPAYFTFFLSLVAFWALLLLKEGDEKNPKIARFIVFTLLGMIGAQAFTFFPHALRVIMKDYGAALLDPAVSILRRTGPIMFIVVVLTLLAIWHLAKSKKSGWYYALISGLLIAIASFPVHYLRPSASLVPAGTAEATIFTSAYWMAGAQGIILVILLLLPYFKQNLVTEK